ncbi:TetR/AcrR family transcriptional regulator [Uliginosibacterium sp. TH139]|jgi:AcrR family transcriptional regulator|uniref:TetR/AcrR family transcriptional regulator n=1 Tax=Uliginosibacterium sp. TH139 TaxID=2067453 RepID=UPI000C7AB2C4|nr:TetR/AcrR family transcriptional regulator [Uliginosibacterium sp. TH139]PLK50432.1 TetR/AcrR family transcriptional regulator [Uliginosibacterium sp. TH139]
MTRRTLTAAPPDHRSRVGAARREKTRTRLIESALLVFASRGVDASVIDEVIARAGVSRGTFYNHFRANEDLFAAAAEAASNEIVRLIDPLVLQHRDPGARVAAGLRLALSLARRCPPFAAFVTRGGVAAIRQGGEATAKLMRDIGAGLASGRFSPLPPRLLQDLVLGPVVCAFETMAAGEVAAEYPELFAQAILQALGVPGATAARLAREPLGELILPEDSLFVRVSQLMAEPD